MRLLPAFPKLEYLDTQAPVTISVGNKLTDYSCGGSPGIQAI